MFHIILYLISFHSMIMYPNVVVLSIIIMPGKNVACVHFCVLYNP